MAENNGIPHISLENRIEIYGMMMEITKKDLKLWETDNPDLVLNSLQLSENIRALEKQLKVNLPKEYREYLRLVADQACGPVDEVDNFLVSYESYSIKAVMAVLSPTESVIRHTRLLQESAGDSWRVLPTGLIAIGSDYDDDGDAYIIYDVRPESVTYLHVFHWKYDVADLIAGSGLGLLAHSLKEFLQMPIPQEEC